jgi:hypothetical protein
MQNIETITKHLNERRAAQLPAIVEQLEAAIAAGVVPNTLMTEAKWIINSVAHDATEAFLATGPRSKPGMSDWWHAAYGADAFVSGATNIPTAIKRTAKVDALKAYNEFLNALLPLHTMMQAAKPLIAKRGDNRLPPKPKTVEQIAMEARQMTCQCCGRKHLANTGKMAHHGYERPGFGYQTASCMGARKLPFEVSRDTLGRLLEMLRDMLANKIANRNAIEAEIRSFTITLTDYTQKRDPRSGSFPTVDYMINRENYETIRTENATNFGKSSKGSFDDVKASELKSRDREIKNLKDEIDAQQKRYDGWKQTHKWDADADEWQTI